MKIAFNPSTVAALITPPNNKDITFDLRGRNIFARGVKFCGTDTWRDIKINNVSIGSNILDLRDSDNTTLTNINGVVTINSTWRPVVDNLTSDSTTSSLSANQGRVLAGLINGKSDSGHTHDDRYYTKAESNAKYITDITTSVNKLTFTKNGSNIDKDIKVNVVYSQGNLTNISDKNATTKASSGLFIYNSYNQVIGTNSYSSVLSINTGGTIQIAGNWGDDQSRNLYWRSQSDRDVSSYPWKSWRTILDSENYSSTLDSRYYTESEVNNLLDAKLNRQNLSYGTWNPRGYNLAADYSYNGGDLSISESEGKIHISVDGYFWQNEGQYRVLDTSDIGSIRGSITIQQYLSNSDTNWYPLIWGGNDHRNTYTSTGGIYKSYDKLSWQTSSQTLYATHLRTTDLNTQTALFHPGDDSTLKIYSGRTQDTVSDGHIGLQTSIDNTDGQTHAYPTQYGSRCVLALQPRGGSVYIGNMPNGGNGCKLNVNGDIGLLNTGSIRDLTIGGGIYWNPYVESTTDSGDSASITLVRQGVAGGTTLVLSQMNDSNDTIQFQTNGSARLYHNSYPILTTQNTYVSNNKGYINGTEITQVNNADTLDGYHENSFLRYRGATRTDQEATLWDQIGIKEYYGALPDGLTGVYNYGSVISLPGNYSRFEIYASHGSSSGNGLYYRSGWDSDKKSWLKFIDSSNIGSQTVASANKLTTARKIWGQSFDGTADISGNMSSVGQITFLALSGTNGRALLYQQMADNDYFRIYARGTASNSGYVEIATADNGNEPIYVRQYTGVFSSVVRTLTLLDANGYTHFPSYINIGGNENNNSSPDRVWGSNSSDSYLRSYRTSALNVNYASSAGNADTVDGVHVNQLCRIYTFNVHNSIIKVGTLTSGQGGHVCKLRFNSGIGYSAENQDKTMTVVIRASNGGANSNGFYFEAHSESYRGGAFTTFYLHQTSKTQCELYMSAFNWSGQSTYEVSFSAGDSWTNEISVQNALPTSNIFTLPNYQIAYTDYNVASATKLATARTIWGQSFDGTGDIPINVAAKMPYVFFKRFDNNENAGYVGCGSSSNNNIYIESYTNANILLNGNNIGIGTYSPTYKLHVAGDIYTTTGFKKNGSSDSYVLLGGGGHQTISSLSVNYASSAGSATKVIVNQHTTNDTNYPLVWSNQSNTNSVTENQLYKSWSDLYYNPKNKRLTVGGSVVASSFIKSDGTSQQLLRADGGIAAFNWSGQSGQPTWLWGGNNQHSYYVYNPSNFRVAYATSAGSADTLDGVHLSGIFTAFGNNGHNITATIGGTTKSFLVNWAADSDKLDGYHASNLLTSVTNTNNGISVTVGGTTKSVSNISVNYATSSGNADTAQYLRSLGNQNCQTGRTQNYGDVYTYNTYANNTGAPTSYTSVIGFGRGIAGTVEIAGGWDNTNLYWRSLRDCCEDWYSWRTVLDSNNYTEFINNYYWANVKISTSSSTTTSPTVYTLTATRVCAGHNPGIDNSISCSNWFRSSGATGWYNTTYNGGWYMSDTSWIRAHNGVGIYTSGNVKASGFHHVNHDNDDAVLLAGGSYKTLNSIYGGDSNHPVFLGYLNLDHGNDGTVSSSFYCLGYSVPFTYTRGGNYCKISIPDTTHQAFYIKAATASVNYSGGGMDTWTGNNRGAGAWWLHCYAPSSNEVRVKGFHLKDTNNDSWWGGNPLWSDRSGVNRITVCIFGYVTFR